ncbi:MAG: tetratricopeptide repeat protein [Bacillota bacterium]
MSRLGFTVVLPLLVVLQGCSPQAKAPELEVKMGQYWWAENPDSWYEGDQFPSSRTEIALAVKAPGGIDDLRVEWSLSGPDYSWETRQEGDWTVFTLVHIAAREGDPEAFLPVGRQSVRLYAQGQVAEYHFDVVPSAHQLMYEGIEAYSVSRYGEAIDLLEQALELAREESRQYLEAAGLMDDEIAVKEEERLAADIYYFLAYAYRDHTWEDPAEGLTKAENACREALRLDPYFHQYHALLGDVLRLQGRYYEALRAFQAAIALSKDDLRLLDDPEQDASLRRDLAYHYFWMGVTLQDSGRLEEAGQALAEAVRLYPGLQGAIDQVR